MSPLPVWHSPTASHDDSRRGDETAVSRPYVVLGHTLSGRRPPGVGHGLRHHSVQIALRGFAAMYVLLQLAWFRAFWVHRSRAAPTYSARLMHS